MSSVYSRDESTLDSIGNDTPPNGQPHSKSGARMEETEVPTGSKSQDLKENIKTKSDRNENKDGEPSKPAEIDDDHYA